MMPIEIDLRECCVCSYKCIYALRQLMRAAILAVWQIAAFPLVYLGIIVIQACHMVLILYAHI